MDRRFFSARDALLVTALLFGLSACSSRVPLNQPPVPIRAAGDPAKPKRPDLYTVQRGDSLTSISQRYQLTVAEITQWNALPANHSLQAGQVLRLTAPAGMASSVPAAPPASGPASNSAGVNTGAVKPSTVEAKPLDPKPLDSKPADPKQTDPKLTDPKPADPKLADAKPQLKTAPRGTKRPYSDALFAEMTGQPLADPAKDEKTAKGGTWGWPAAGKVVQDFQAPKANGLLIAGKTGDAILAAADGTVIFSGEGPRGFGNLVIVKHPGDLVSVYGNNKAVLVKEGQSVKKGARLAEMGNSGNDKTQLIFEVRQAGKPVDPNKFLVLREEKPAAPAVKPAGKTDAKTDSKSNAKADAKVDTKSDAKVTVPTKKPDVIKAKS